MSLQLDENYLELIWAGTIEPLLKECFFAEPEKLAEFAFEKDQVYLEERELEEERSESPPAKPEASIGSRSKRQ